MRGLDHVTVDDAMAAKVAVGAVLARPDGEGPWAIMSAAGDLLAVYEAHRPGTAKPAVVLPS